MEAFYNDIITAGQAIFDVDATRQSRKTPTTLLTMTNLIVKFDDGTVIKKGDIFEFLEEFQTQVVAGKRLSNGVNVYTRLEDTLPSMGNTEWELELL
jgi:hypothetical protein